MMQDKMLSVWKGQTGVWTEIDQVKTRTISAMGTEDI
jgi:hypothetical protein